MPTPAARVELNYFKARTKASSILTAAPRSLKQGLLRAAADERIARLIETPMKFCGARDADARACRDQRRGFTPQDVNILAQRFAVHGQINAECRAQATRPARQQAN